MEQRPAPATSLYECFFGLVEPLLPRGSDRRVAVAGVVWPAMAWLDEPIPDFADGGAATLGDASASDRELVEALKAVYPRPDQRQRLDELAALREQEPDDPASLQQLHVLYPIASLSSREDAAGRSELAYRWGALGHDGAQAVDGATADVQPVHGRYPYARGRFLNVDAADVVRSGRPPTGAHSDILHPELAWIAVSAAGLATRAPTRRPGVTER